MPPNHGIWSNDGECAAGLRKQVAGPTQNDPVDSQKWHPVWLAPSQHDDLLLSTRISASSAARDRNRSTTKPKICLQRSPNEDRPILSRLPTGSDLRQGHPYGVRKNIVPTITVGIVGLLKKENPARRRIGPRDSEPSAPPVHPWSEHHGPSRDTLRRRADSRQQTCLCGGL
jgi:hypothetical protein